MATNRAGIRVRYTVVSCDPELGHKSRTFSDKRRVDALRDYLNANATTLSLATAA